MTDTQDNLSIVSTERRVWLLLVDQRENGAESRVGSRIETLTYTTRRHADAQRLIEVSRRASEDWKTSGPKLGEEDDLWRITFERPLSKAEWYVAGPNGRTAELSTEMVARLDAINDEQWEDAAALAQPHRGDARLVRDLLAVDASPEQIAAALAGEDEIGVAR